MIGMMMSPTSELTMAPNAAPMTTPTARSTTLPRIANFLNSSNMRPPYRAACLRDGALSARCRIEEGMDSAPSVDQPGMHHGLANGRLCLLGRRHHRQPERIRALAEERKRIFDRRWARLDEQIDMQRRELVLQFERGHEIALQARRLEFGAQPRRNIGRHRNTAMAAMGH